MQDTGGFIIIDRLTNVTVGAGLVRDALAERQRSPQERMGAFETELKALILKHFPEWDAKI